MKMRNVCTSESVLILKNHDERDLLHTFSFRKIVCDTAFTSITESPTESKEIFRRKLNMAGCCEKRTLMTEATELCTAKYPILVVKPLKQHRHFEMVPT